MSTATNVAQNQPEVNEDGQPNFGGGRYSFLMEKSYAGLVKHFKVSLPVAEAAARKIGSDAGALMASCKVEFKVGKVSKDGKVTVSELAKMKGVTVTRSLMVVRALAYIDDAGMNGISYGLTQWQPSTPVKEWLMEIEAKLPRAE